VQLGALKVFCDVVETRSFSRAARLNRITQSAVSQAIRGLESRFERRLLDRTPRAVRPTAAGEKLYEGARDVLARFAAVEAELREQEGRTAGAVTLASITSVGIHELQAYLREMLRLHPGVRVKLVYRTSDQVQEDVLQGDADVGLVAYPRARRELEMIRFGEDRLVLVAAPGHPLARQPRVPLAALDRQPYVAFEKGVPTRAALDALLHRHGAAPKVVMELDNVETLKAAVEVGLGVSILPQASVDAEVGAGTLVQIAIADGTFTRPLALLVRRGRTPTRAAAALLDVLGRPLPRSPGPL
jgi:DNA-binding transcriptional LysR family regulator